MEDALFEIPLWADLLAVGVGALQGALFAARFTGHHLDLLGVAVIGVCAGLGGGILRDLVLSAPIATFQSNWYILVAVAAALLGMLLERVFSKLNSVFTIIDALNLGLFAAIGATKAIAFGLPAIPAAMVGVLTAIGGSILRDLMMTAPVQLLRVGPLNTAAAIAGTTLLVILTTAGVATVVAAIACVAVTFIVRVLALAQNWRVPEQRRIERLPRIPHRGAQAD